MIQTTQTKLLIILSLFITSISFAQLKAVKGKTTYNFWINLPEKSILENKPPVLISLHGRSLSGTDLNRVKRYGIIRGIERGRKIPAIVIAPQLPKGPWDPKKVIEILDYVQKKYQIDRNRVYVAGMSLGSYGTMDVVGTYPDRIAGAVSICGGGNTKMACKIAEVPVWVLHGTADRAVKISESEKIVNAVKACNPKAPITFTRIKGGTHGSVENLFHKDATYEWLFKQNKKNPELAFDIPLEFQNDEFDEEPEETETKLEEIQQPINTETTPN